MTYKEKLEAIKDIVLPKETNDRHYKPICSEYITIRVTPETLTKIRNIAIKDDKAISTVCKNLIMKGLSK